MGRRRFYTAIIGNEEVKQYSVKKSVLFAICLLGLSGCMATKSKDTFDLTAYDFTQRPLIKHSKKRIQLLITAPTAIKPLDGEDLLIKDQANAIAYFRAAQWADRLPNLIQTRLVQAFENSRLFSAVARPGQGVSIDYELITDLRAFNIVLCNKDYNNIDVEISASILREADGVVKATRRFKLTKAIAATNSKNLKSYVYAPALNEAFNDIAKQMILWTRKNT